MDPKKDSIRLSTYDELFSSPPRGGPPGSPGAPSGPPGAPLGAPGAPAGAPRSALKKFRSLKRKSLHAGKATELVAALQRQRVVIDERAIHFVAEARAGRRADARNSVFKLAQKYKVLPESERMQRIKQLYGKVRENEDSGDEEWDKAAARLPGKLDPQAFWKILHKEDSREHLLTEMEEINQETAGLGPAVVSQQQLTAAEQAKEIGLMLQQKEQQLQQQQQQQQQQEGEEEKAEQEEEDSDESDVEFDDDDMNTLNSLQREFVGNNLFQWFKDIQKAYESGVKLVKVNRMGYKFIRIVTIKEMLLTIHQPHTHSQAKVDRQVAVHSIVSVSLGKDSKEFAALEELVKEKKEAAEFNPQGTVCCVVKLPKNRSLSLVFLDEDNRNGFVFFLRVLMKKAKAAVQQLEEQSAQTLNPKP